MKFIILFMFFVLVSFSDIQAQVQEKANIRWGEYLKLSASAGFELYETEQLNTYTIIPVDIFISLPIHRLMSVGLNFSPIYVTDSFQEKNNFFRTSAFLRLSGYSFKDRLIFSGDLIGSYGNFVIELDEALNKRNVFYVGLRFNMEYEIFSKLYLQAGYKLIRQLEKGDFGLDNYPYLGLSYRIPTRKR